MEKGLNFNTLEGQQDYYKVYDKSLGLFMVPITEKYVETSFGKSHELCYGDSTNAPLVLLHAASCGSTIWYPNIEELGKRYCIFAVDLITEFSKSILLKKIKKPVDNAQWLNETLDALCLKQVSVCGLSIGGWTAANFATFFPDRVQN